MPPLILAFMALQLDRGNMYSLPDSALDIPLADCAQEAKP